jgi:hypothetical protein
MTSPMQKLATQLENDERLDGIAEQLGTWFDGAVKPGPVKDLLSGTWFGHPIHPPLTAGVVGMWSGAALLDLLGGERALLGRRRGVRLRRVGIRPATAECHHEGDEGDHAGRATREAARRSGVGRATPAARDEAGHDGGSDVRENSVRSPPGSRLVLQNRADLTSGHQAGGDLLSRGACSPITVLHADQWRTARQ